MIPYSYFFSVGTNTSIIHHWSISQLTFCFFNVLSFLTAIAWLMACLDANLHIFKTVTIISCILEVISQLTT